MDISIWIFIRAGSIFKTAISWVGESELLSGLFGAIFKSHEGKKNCFFTCPSSSLPGTEWVTHDSSFRGIDAARCALGRPKNLFLFSPLPSEKWMQLGWKMAHKIFQHYRPINRQKCIFGIFGRLFERAKYGQVVRPWKDLAKCSSEVLVLGQ